VRCGGDCVRSSPRPNHGSCLPRIFHCFSPSCFCDSISNCIGVRLGGNRYLVGRSISGVAARTGSQGGLAPQANASGATSTNREVTCVDGMMRVVCGFGRFCLGQSRFSCRTRVDNTSLQLLFVSHFHRRSVRPHCVLRQRIFRWNCALRFAVSKADSY